VSVPSNIAGFQWELSRQKSDGELVLRLMTPEQKIAATVWLGTDVIYKHNWHVWDRDGVGGENAYEQSVEAAMYEAEMATVRWGKHEPQSTFDIRLCPECGGPDADGGECVGRLGCPLAQG
jgi:hypothetical protein